MSQHGHDGRRRTPGRRVDHHGLARAERDAAGQRGDDAAACSPPSSARATRQNTIARALARARTQSLGLAISGLANPYFTDLIAAVEAEAGRAGHTLLLGDTREDAEQELRMVQALVERRVDGLLLAPSAGAAEHALPYLAAQDVPVVLLDRLADAGGFDQVGSENEEPTAQLVEHLAARGHRRIGMLVGRRAG